jgi:hypothetical protein
VHHARCGFRMLPRRSLASNKSPCSKCVCHIVLREGGPHLSYKLIRPQKNLRCFVPGLAWSRSSPPDELLAGQQDAQCTAVVFCTLRQIGNSVPAGTILLSRYFTTSYVQQTPQPPSQIDRFVGESVHKRGQPPPSTPPRSRERSAPHNPPHRSGEQGAGSGTPDPTPRVSEGWFAPHSSSQLSLIRTANTSPFAHSSPAANNDTSTRTLRPSIDLARALNSSTVSIGVGFR